jgi:hypothetical protein
MALPSWNNQLPFRIKRRPHQMPEFSGEIQEYSSPAGYQLGNITLVFECALMPIRWKSH